MYAIDQILNEDDVKELLRVYEECECKFAHQDYNLFHLERRDIKREHRELPVFQKLKEYSKMKTNSHYFLRYKEGSFARMHEDSGTDLTVVTYLHTSEDLKGGLPVILSAYERRSRPANHYAKRSKVDVHRGVYGSKIIFDVMDQPETGESLVYGPELKHGVSKVHQGERIVLISWFSNAGENPLRKK